MHDESTVIYQLHPHIYKLNYVKPSLKHEPPSYPTIDG